MKYLYRGSLRKRFRHYLSLQCSLIVHHISNVDVCVYVCRSLFCLKEFYGFAINVIFVCYCTLQIRQFVYMTVIWNVLSLFSSYYEWSRLLLIIFLGINAGVPLKSTRWQGYCALFARNNASVCFLKYCFNTFQYLQYCKLEYNWNYASQG